MNYNFKEGAYYYKDLTFAWESNAWRNAPSIFAVKNENVCIHIPYCKQFMQVEIMPVMYFPFRYENLLVSVLDDAI